MIRLYDNETNQAIGTVTEDQLRFLIDQLEEESDTDQDYYLTTSTIDMLEEDGGDTSMMAMLRSALGNREGMEIRWVRE